MQTRFSVCGINTECKREEVQRLNYTAYGDNRPFITKGKLKRSAPKARIVTEIEDFLATHDVSLGYDHKKDRPIVTITEKNDGR